MLKVNGTRWGHSKELFREEALKAEHTRTRERLMALYESVKAKAQLKLPKKPSEIPKQL